MKLNGAQKKLLSVLLALVVAVSVFANMTPMAARAKETDELQEQIDEVSQERADLAKQMNALKKDIKNNTSEIGRISSEKSIIDQEIALINQDILLLNQQILTYSLLIADKQEELDAAQERLDQITAENKERIRTMEEDGSLSYWSVLFRAHDLADLLDRLNMIEEIAAADRRRLESMRVARQEVVAAQEALNQEKAELETARQEVKAQQALLAEKRVEADKKLVELKERHEEYEEMLEKAEKSDNELLAQIAQLQKEYDEAKKAEDEATRPQVSVGIGQGTTNAIKPPASVTEGLVWVMPCEYKKLTSPWGWRIHPVYGYPRFHDGVDLSNDEGTPIVATRSGTVTIAYYDEESAGYYVSINHGDGFSSTYMHMTHYIVKLDQEVEAGEVVGYMGSTGVSTGVHLHFGISYDGSTQNPADYLDFE